jgi:hypothetical protein
MYQWLNDNPRMAMHKGEYAAKTSYDDWQDVTVRNGHAAVQESLVVQKYQELLRDIPVHSQWVQLNQDNPDEYTVSITLPTIPGLGKNAGNFIDEDDEIGVFFEPKPTKVLHPITKEPIIPPASWNGMIVRPDELEVNTGTHVIRVWRHRDGAISDTRAIPAEKSWAKRCPYVPIYIQLKESTRTVRARLNALGLMHPRAAKRNQTPSDPAGACDAGDEAETILNMVAGEEADEMEIGPAYVRKLIDYTRQRAIIVGHEVSEVKPYDFFETLSEEQNTEVLSKCTERQREALREIARSAPNGILPIVGAGGTGKTTFTIRLLRAAFLQGKTALVTSSTKAAVNNIAIRAGKFL